MNLNYVKFSTIPDKNDEKGIPVGTSTDDAKNEGKGDGEIKWWLSI